MRFFPRRNCLLKDYICKIVFFFHCEKASSLAIGDFEAGVVSLRIGLTLFNSVDWHKDWRLERGGFSEFTDFYCNLYLLTNSPVDFECTLI